LRDTDVQQPKTTATLSWVMSWRAFSAKSGQLEAGSTGDRLDLEPHDAAARVDLLDRHQRDVLQDRSR
jgi:hypothetical protein